jgi:hypothetical protein
VRATNQVLIDSLELHDIDVFIDISNDRCACRQAPQDGRAVFPLVT